MLELISSSTLIKYLQSLEIQQKFVSYKGKLYFSCVISLEISTAMQKEPAVGVESINQFPSLVDILEQSAALSSVLSVLESQKLGVWL